MRRTGLKLRAEDAQDIDVIAAILQDAIAPLCEMTYLKAESNFVMVVQRFCWDKENTPITTEDGKTYHTRIHSALDIKGVTNVQHSGLVDHPPNAMLDLLTITLSKDAPAPTLDLVFAGDAQIRLTLHNWSLKLEDFGESWPTPNCPTHSLDEANEGCLYKA